jgi:hypothetical protein
MVMMKSSLSNANKRLLEALQKTNYGRLERLSIVNGDPIWNPPPRIVKDIKLGSTDTGPRVELESTDFALKREHVELFDQLQRLGNGIIECIEIKGGLPFRLILEQQL